MPSVTGQDIADFLNERIPPQLALTWDNCGWQAGDPALPVKRVLLALDPTPSVLDEAVQKGAQLMVTHHPLLLEPIRQAVAGNTAGGLVYQLARKNIGLFSMHTNLDAVPGGINDDLLAATGARSTGLVLEPSPNQAVYKLVVFVPHPDIEKVSKAICAAGAGRIGNYSHCTYRVDGTGTFIPLDGANPTIGSRHTHEEVREYRLEVIVPESRIQPVMSAMRAAHSYEEPAFDIYPLKSPGCRNGLGRIGEFDKPITQQALLRALGHGLKTTHIRYSGKLRGRIRRLSVCAGSGAGFWRKSMSMGCQAHVTADVKYHDALDARERGFLLIDAGHYATEKPFMKKVGAWLRIAFPRVTFTHANRERDPFDIFPRAG